MSPLGKLITVINLVLAAAFLGWASNNLATSQQYKSQLETTQGELATCQQEKDDEGSRLRQEVGAHESAKAALREERDSVKADRDRLQGEVDAERSRNTALTSDVAAIKSTLENYDETNRLNAQRVDQANTDKEAAVAAQRDAESASEQALGAQRQAEEDLRSANVTMTSLRDEVAQLQEHATQLDTQLATLVEYTGVSLSEITAMPPIDGAVLQVVTSIEPGLVAINKGASDGVKRGFTFEIYAGATYKGQVRVESVQSNMCTAVIVREVDGAHIGQGDSASTRI